MFLFAEAPPGQYLVCVPIASQGPSFSATAQKRVGKTEVNEINSLVTMFGDWYGENIVAK